MYTKRQALEDCLSLWHELATTGNNYKTGCPACTYTNRYSLECYNCPLAGRWHRRHVEIVCTQDDSIFMRWLTATGNRDTRVDWNNSQNPSKRSRQYWARQIVLACQEALAELDKEEKDA